MRRKETRVDLDIAVIFYIAAFVIGIGMGVAAIFGGGMLMVGIPLLVIGVGGIVEVISCCNQHDRLRHRYYHRPALPKPKSEREKLEVVRNKIVRELEDMSEEDVYYEPMRKRVRELEDAMHLIGTRSRDEKRKILLKQSGQLVAKTVNREMKELEG